MEEALDGASQGSSKRRKRDLNSPEQNGELPDQPSDTNDLVRESDVTWYNHILNEHIQLSRLALVGQFDLKPGVVFRHADTIVPPLNTVWTPYDKAPFFTALSRHSRWRPDLIAKDIGRTEGEVSDYLELLEEGADAVTRSDGVKEGYRDRSARWKTSHNWREGKAPASHEVSDNWVEEEENLAIALEEAMRKKWEEKKEEDRSIQRSEALTEARLAEGRRPDRVKDRDDILGHFDRQTNREIWGESLDSHKLDSLNLAFHGLVGSTSEDRENNTGSPEKTPGTPNDSATIVSPNKFAKIAIENRTIDLIQEVPARDRTSEQKAILIKLVNKKRNRERYRMKQLIDEGMTEEDIETQGGVDAVFQKRKTGRTVEEIDLLSPPRTRNGANHSNDMKALRILEYATSKGWDLFSLTRVKRITELHPNRHPLLSFTIFDILRNELLAFLTPLVLHSIMVAEQSVLQRGTQGDVTHKHVDQALLLKYDDPTESQRKTFEGLTDVAHDLENSERSKRRRASIMSPGNVPWLAMNIPLPLRRSQAEDGAETDLDLCNLDATSTISDEEDKALDEAMEFMDSACAEVAEESLRSKKLDRHLLNGRKKMQALLGSNPVERRAQKAEKEYNQLLVETGKARRWRRAVTARSSKFPTTRLRHEGGRLRTGKSRAVVIDSDEDFDMDSGDEQSLRDEIESEEGDEEGEKIDERSGEFVQGGDNEVVEE